MSGQHNGNQHLGRYGGMKVRGMIKEMEQRIAAGEQVSAAPSSSEEAEQLHKVREENAASHREGQG